MIHEARQVLKLSPERIEFLSGLQDADGMLDMDAMIVKLLGGRRFGSRIGSQRGIHEAVSG